MKPAGLDVRPQTPLEVAILHGRDEAAAVKEEDELGGAAAVANPEDRRLAVRKNLFVAVEVVEDVLVIGGGVTGVDASLGSSAGGGNPFTVDGSGRRTHVLDLTRRETAEGEAIVGDSEVVADGDPAQDGETDASDGVEKQMGGV